MTKIFIWTGYFRDQADFEQYTALHDEPFLDQPTDEGEEEAASFFCEDTDLPYYDESFQQFAFLPKTVASPDDLPGFLAEVTDTKRLHSIIFREDYPAFNALMFIREHKHTRYYRGAARPGAPVRFVGCFESPQA